MRVMQFLLTVGVFGVSLAFILLLFSPFMLYFAYARDIQNKEQLVNKGNTGLVLLDRNGNEFFSFDHAKEITYIPLSSVPQSMQRAVIAAEDKNFYTNPGFSITGIIRASFADIFTHEFVQGGSTITQQLVKNTLLTSQKSFIRKFQEVMLAYAITKKYSKQDVLEMYLNSAYFGEGAFGVENAAQTYFGISAKDLDLAQSALLIGLLPAPSAYSPLSNDPSIAKSHQKEVLSQMKEQGYISSDDLLLAENENLTFASPPPSQAKNTLAPHFALMVRDKLFKEYGEGYVIRAGFHVKTTIDSNWQTYAQQVVARQVSALSYQRVSNGAAVMLDPKTGEILALVGSHNWDDPTNGKINMAITPRQPGSSFKPIVYGTAFDEHILTPATILHDDPTVFPGNYKPKDFDKRYRGPVTVRRALANSLNIPAVETMQDVGVAEAISMAQQMGITTLGDPSQYGLSLVLGAGEVTLLDLTDAYATLANAGVQNAPISIMEIKDNTGNVIYSESKNPKQALSDGASFLISSILSDANARAEEFGNALTISYPAAVKTGTTEDFRDSLTMGYTPTVTVGVWVGNNDNTPMDQVAGSLGAAPIWKQLMTYALTRLPNETFTQPDSVTKQVVCPYSFINARTTMVSTKYTEYFLSGTEPPTPCSAPTVVYPSYPVPSFPTNMPLPTFPSDTPAPAPPTDTPIPFPTQPSFDGGISPSPF